MATLLWFLTSLGVSAVVSAQSATDLFNGRGFSPNREFFSELPFEHIDPLTGNLLLTFTDLELPGNGGFNLKIQRSYNSKVYATYSCTGTPPSSCATTPVDDSWAGFGWTLHFGRVINPTSTNPGPIIEMPDGSRHQTYLHMDGNTSHFMTRDYWTYDKTIPGAPVLRLPNGISYIFGTSRGGYQYATEIKDPFGNKVAIFYVGGLAAHDVIERVEQHLVGGPTRTVTFAYSDTIAGVDADSLLEIKYEPPGSTARTWTFTQTRVSNLSVGYTRLDKVQPPEGAAWEFGHEATNHLKNPSILKSLKTPNGGIVEYVYRPQQFQLGSSVLFSPAIETRTVKDRGGVLIGTWTHVYSAVTTPPQTLTTKIMSPCGSRIEHTFLGLGPSGNERPWAIGVHDTKVVFESGAQNGGVELEREKLTWLQSTRISNVLESASSVATHVPLLQKRTITRGGKVYETTFTYDSSAYSAARASNFNDFGRPKETLESGEAGAHTRKTARTFFYFPSNADPSFANHIVDKIATEKLYVPSSSTVPFERGYTYETSGGYKGFKKSETIHEIKTDYAPHAVGGIQTGNVGTSTSARGFVTTYSYSNGVLASVTTPEDPAGTPSLSRVINPDGTIDSETRRIFTGNQVEPATTSFDYDSLMRPTLRTPPLGNPTSTNYDAAGTFVRVTRGAYQLTTNLDGFARTTGTFDNEPSNPTHTKIAYDACGRKSFESYPHKGTPPNPPGTSFTFDALGRVKTKTDPADESGPAAVITYAYPAGVNVTITDENNHVAEQKRSAFGDVSETRLVSVKDALQKTTSYVYNALGSLEKVTHPAASGSTGSTFQRTWVYHTPSDAGGHHGLLKSETHPESGTVTYTYDAGGNVAARTDANGTVTSFTYDNNDRLKTVDHPGTAHDKAFGYDPLDNRTSATNSFVASTFSYDLAGRLASRRDVVAGHSLTTRYDYDANDNLEILTYPAVAGLRRVKYEYDTVNRISRVLNPDPPNTVYAQTFSWHPSGAIASFVAGNGLTHTSTYNNRYRLKTATPGGASVLNLTYTYEPNGNVKSINDSRAGFNQTFAYDSVDRLTNVTGWNAGDFVLDEIGNRTNKTAGGSASYSYNAATNRVTSITEGGPAQTLTYDNNGNLKDDGRLHTYTPENMLETVAGSTYRYDADNLRKLKIQGTTNRFFLHDAQGQVISEFEQLCPQAGLQHVRDYVFAGGRLLAAVRPSGTTAVTVGFEAPASTRSEAVGSVPVGVRVTTSNGSGLPCPVSVSYASANGTAVAPADYALSSGIVNFAAGTIPSGPDGVQNIPLPIVQDALDEADETFTLTLGSASGAQLGQALHTVTIADDDPQPALSVGDVSVTEGDSGSVNAVFTVTLSAASGKTVSARYDTADGTATAGSDYGATTGTLTIAPGETSKTLFVQVSGDLRNEPSQTFLVNLSQPVEATLADGQAVGTILDNDPAPTISIQDAALIENNGFTTQMPFSVTLSAPSDYTITMNYATSDGTALAAADYGSASGVLTFTPGTLSQVVRVDVFGDQAKELNETFLVTLTLSGGAQATMGDGQATGTILDDEPEDFFTIAPCRLLDTRDTGQALTANSTRLFAAAGLCGIPSTAKAIAVNVTAVSPTAAGNLLLFPARTPQPLATSLNFNASVTRSNNAMVTLGSDGQLAVQCNMAPGSTTHLVIDVFGYLE